MFHNTACVHVPSSPNIILLILFFSFPRLGFSELAVSLGTAKLRPTKQDGYIVNGAHATICALATWEHCCMQHVLRNVLVLHVRRTRSWNVGRNMQNVFCKTCCEHVGRGRPWFHDMTSFVYMSLWLDHKSHGKVERPIPARPGIVFTLRTQLDCKHPCYRWHEFRS